VDAGVTWQLRPGQTLQHRGWDGEFIVYNDLSGDTHLLGEAAIEILLALDRAPATPAALMDMLDAEFDIDPAELGQETDSLLQHLERLYLIDRVAC
jgi:PqqD family protein of HPr-rel-A system